MQAVAGYGVLGTAVTRLPFGLGIAISSARTFVVPALLAASFLGSRNARRRLVALLSTRASRRHRRAHHHEQELDYPVRAPVRAHAALGWSAAGPRVIAAVAAAAMLTIVFFPIVSNNRVARIDESFTARIGVLEAVKRAPDSVAALLSRPWGSKG